VLAAPGESGARSVRYSVAAGGRSSLWGILNAINVIVPYKHHGMWVFDDPHVGLAQEPFISGADTLIDRAVSGISGAGRGFLLIFSARAFPGYDIHLTWRRPDMDGNCYYSARFDHEAWLCPALLKYFDEVPRELFVQCKAKSSDA
jgi:hypothetical protein